MADPQLIAAENKREIKRCYDAVFRSADGQVVLNDLLARGFMIRPTMVPGDPIMSAFNEGQRALCLYVLDQIYISTDQRAAILRLITNKASEASRHENY